MYNCPPLIITKQINNSALRIATGCYSMARINHLQSETKVLPLIDHSRMITQQYLAACHLPGHPGREQLDKPPDPRRLKPGKTMQIHREDVKEFFETQTDNLSYKDAIKTIHTRTVESVINSYLPNRVLGTAPPPINKEEKTINRKARSGLAQLRSGFSKILNYYNNRIDENIPNICPLCAGADHSTNHLFNCPSNPTTLTTESLWTDPIKAAQFLQLEMEQEPEIPP